MNKPVFILLFILSFSHLRAQNLIPNGDFEFYTQCPNGYSEIFKAFPWYEPGQGTSDYYNVCSSSPDVSIPNNWAGHQQPHSGNGYAGLNDLAICPGWCSEYIATPLKEPLIGGNAYCLSLWVSKSDYTCWDHNGLGVYFSSDSIHFNDYLLSDLPLGNIVFTEIITDTINWVFLSGTYIASGGESFISIGNFSKGNMDTLDLCNVQELSNVYVDDVSLINCSELLNEFTIPNIFSPNNDNVNDIWLLNTIEKVKVTILNRWGNIIFEGEGKNISWNGLDQTEGVYFYKIETSKTVKTGFIQLMR